MDKTGKLCAEVELCSIDNKLLNSLISCEPETVLALPDSSVPDDEKITQTLSNLYEKQLVGIIEWAKQIPGLYCNEF